MVCNGMSADFRRVEFETTCSVGERIVLSGRALTQVPSRTAPA